MDQEIDGPDGLEIMSEIISLACISIMALLFGSKSKIERFNTLTYGRTLVILLYILSWTFSAIAIVSVSTNNWNKVSCVLGVMICDVFYAGSKVTIYAWLIERVHLVTAVRVRRMKSIQYRFHLALLCPYVGIFILMLIFRNAYIDENGICIMGLQPPSSIPLMLLNLYLTFLFVKPLVRTSRRHDREDWRETRLYKLTRRTLVASAVCLIVSLVNILTLAITQGHERGLMCLSMCTVDVTINVITIHWVTSTNIKMSVRHPTIPTMDEYNRTATPPPLDSTFDMGDHQEFYPDKYIIPQVNKKCQEDNDSVHSAQLSHNSAKPLQAEHPAS
ncbi:hypothetical protein RO3G_13977 [Lichtheimia corymbifera JMRC:FSU:9682]|uniref:G-protein coupled receptors family 1 profile domain-containing protein n=1 Tax=Lichtheimia corymbifera JMRC:FSU:9682 TaxID=1263082 RepID=A0A068RY91_9FUNG|nr:hypothetical protein RO3G_13977 [Lichtheimia corymbifera JMRC:FSU:9682]